MTFLEWYNIDYLNDVLNGLLNGKGRVELSKHFIDRLNDRSIRVNNVIDAIHKFVNIYQTQLSDGHYREIHGVIKDVATHLNIPITYDTKGTPTPKDDVMHLITVMRKHNFIPNNPNDKVFKV
jgi:hypothetical protein